MGVGGVRFSGKNRYEGVRFNVICVMRGWVGVQFPIKGPLIKSRLTSLYRIRIPGYRANRTAGHLRVLKRRNFHCDAHVAAENKIRWPLETKARVRRFDFRTCVCFPTK